MPWEWNPHCSPRPSVPWNSTSSFAASCSCSGAALLSFQFLTHLALPHLSTCPALCPEEPLCCLPRADSSEAYSFFLRGGGISIPRRDLAALATIVPLASGIPMQSSFSGAWTNKLVSRFSGASPTAGFPVGSGLASELSFHKSLRTRFSFWWNYLLGHKWVCWHSRFVFPVTQLWTTEAGPTEDSLILHSLFISLRHGNSATQLETLRNRACEDGQNPSVTDD